MARGALCLRHGRSASRYRLTYPQPDSTPPVMRWMPPGPSIWLCAECASEAREWAEQAESE